METQKSKVQWTKAKGAKAEPRISAEKDIWADSTTTTIVQKRSLHKLWKTKTLHQKLQKKGPSPVTNQLKKKPKHHKIPRRSKEQKSAC